MSLPTVFLALTLMPVPGAAPGAAPRLLQGFLGPGAAQACQAAAEDLQARLDAAGVRMVARCALTREA